MMNIQKNILLIDDQEDFSEAIHSFLTPPSYKIFNIQAIDDLLDIVKNNEIILFLFNLNMNDTIMCYQLLEFVKNDESTDKIPIMFFSNNDNNIDNFLDKFGDRIVDYIVNPIRETIVKKRIKRLVSFYEMNLKLKYSNARIDEYLNFTEDSLFIIDPLNEIAFFSNNFKDKLNLDSNKLELFKLYDVIHYEDKEILKRLFKEKEKFEVSIRFIANKKDIRSLEFNGKNCFSEQGKLLGSIFTLKKSIDVDDLADNRHQKKSSISANNQINQDPITGLLNRNVLTDHISFAIAHAKRYKTQIAILLLDLDHFKRINDSMGHEVGDMLLKMVAGRLKTIVRETDTIARIGGDEFIFIITDVFKAQNAVSSANKILRTFTQPFMLKEHEIFITASIGISFYSSDGNDIETLMKNADTAMYRAKNLGRNNYQLYAPEMNAKAFEQLALENHLRKAINNDELVIFYQPRVHIETGAILGVEALVRWMHPELGLVSPDVFIPIAEETGLILSMGETILRKSCLQHKIWMDQGFPKFRMGVNLSMRQFQQEDLAETVQSIIKETKIDQSYLELEITESMAMQNVDLTLETLGKLNKMGLRIAMDDFGTGYSSLSYLRKYPIHTLKIDQSFIKDITLEKDVVTIIKVILELARGLKLDVIAEGVETYEQKELLRSLSCYEMQGYLFSVPLPAKEIAPLLQEGKMVFSGILPD